MKKLSIKLIWTFFYTLTLLIPLSTTLTLFLRINSILKTEIEEKNYFLLQKMEQNIELQISSAQIAVNEIYLNESFLQISKMKLPLSAADKYVIYEFVQDLRTLKNANKNNFEFLLYFRNIDWVIALNTSRDSRSYYDTFYGNAEPSYEDWKKNVLQNNNSLFCINSKLSGNEPTLYYACPITISKSTNNIVNILIGLDYSKIIKEYHNLYSSDDGTLFITDINGNLLTSIGNSGIQFSEFNQPPANSYEADIQIIHGEKHAILTYFSEKSNLQLTYILPSKIYLSELRPVYILTTAAYAFSITIGIILIFFFMKITYRPVNDLVNIFNQNYTFQHNEFELIKHGIQENHMQKMYYRNISNQQKDIIRHYTILHILHGLLTGNNSLEQLFSDLNIKQISDNFVVIACHYYNAPLETEAEHSSGILTTFRNMAVDALISSGNTVFDTIIDNEIIIIVNIPPNVSDTRNIQYTMQKTYNEATTLYHIPFFILLSNIHNNIYGIADAYDEIKCSLSSFTKNKPTGIICYHQLNVQNAEYYYPLEKEQLLINYIKSGSQNQALSLLNNIFQENLKNNVLPIELATCLAYDITSTIIKAIEQAPPTSKAGNFRAINPAYLISKCKTIEEMKETLHELLCLCCTHISVNDTDSPDKLVTDVKSYIHANYTDVNLNVSAIADYFCVQQSYLSKIFKKTTHIGLLEYINTYRLNQSAKLLLETSKSINDIYAESGYNNYRTFSRLFLKYYGVSAQAYRNINHNENSIENNQDKR